MSTWRDTSGRWQVPSAALIVLALGAGCGGAASPATTAAPTAAPSGLTYATNPATYTLGVAIAANAPSHAGGAVVSYGVAPPLPAGLGLDPATGVVSGTPAAITAAATYTVAATNSTTVGLVITVNDAAPSGLAYATNPATCALVDGGAWCWGYNGTGQLGDGTTVDSVEPVQVLASWW